MVCFTLIILNIYVVSDALFRLCNRNFGVGGDGVIFALKAPEGEIHFNVFELCEISNCVSKLLTYSTLWYSYLHRIVFQREILTSP